MILCILKDEKDILEVKHNECEREVVYGVVLPDCIYTFQI